MKEEISDCKNERKIWNQPVIFSLDIRKTEGGPFSYQTEDHASGTENTQPSL
jgi:hypothetical protein